PHSEVLRRLLDPEHVAPHDLAGAIVRPGAERQTVHRVLDRDCELVAALENKLEALAVELELVDGLLGRRTRDVADCISLTERDRCGHRHRSFRGIGYSPTGERALPPEIGGTRRVFKKLSVTS